jgi:SAM-dependent MidA family methyltransferase
MNELQQIIRAEIAADGPLSCARFMELALYHKVHGYYEKRSDQVGAGGDFITSVSVGDLFGRLLATRFAEWLRELRDDGRQEPFQIVETGAHTGQLAVDVLTELQTCYPALFELLDYVIVEPSAERTKWQQATLAAFGNKVTWLSGWQDASPVSGIIFSNELLDAFPLHRFVREGNKWSELRIGVTGDSFDWINVPTKLSAGVPEELAKQLPDGFVIERSPAAERWWSDAARGLREGWLMTIDYGSTQDDLRQSGRTAGTLRAYRNHSLADNPLADPGEQDLTAHVNWSAIQQAGEDAGLDTVELTDQSRYLTRILARAVEADSGRWQLSPKQVRQFQMLTHPQHLGRKFQALVQYRKKSGSENGE